MVDAINSSLSGLDAAGRKLEISAINTANSESTQQQIGNEIINKPFLPKDVVTLSKEAQQGVETKVVDRENATRLELDPENPIANEEGFVERPDVDIAREAVARIEAANAFKSNLRVIEKAQEAEEALIKATD